MKRKIKLSFEALERELSQITANQMLSILGGTGGPLPNGDCLFNMVAYMLDGNANDAQCYKDELTSLYTFTPGTTVTGLPGYSYYAEDVVKFMRTYRPGYIITYGDAPNASDIKTILNMDGGKVGASYNGHNYVIESVSNNGKVTMYDSTNGGTISIYASELTGVYNFYKTPGTEMITTTGYEGNLTTTDYEGNPSTTAYEGNLTTTDYQGEHPTTTYYE